MKDGVRGVRITAKCRYCGNSNTHSYGLCNECVLAYFQSEYFIISRHQDYYISRCRSRLDMDSNCNLCPIRYKCWTQEVDDDL